jgi:2,4-didehydro-3-deoxy-L-rhamnonate hydrolase
LKLFRFGPAGGERPGVVLPDGTHADASGFGEDWDERFFGGGGLERLASWVAAHGARAPRAPAGVRLGPAVARPSKIVCIGKNYLDHAKELGGPLPTEPVLFLKATSAWAGAADDLALPIEGVKTDWEVELAVIIGRTARHVAPERALDHVAGFALHNDYSERAFQNERGGQWTKGKSADGFAAFGPYVVLRDAFPGWGRARLWLRVNGATMQDGSTSDMIFDVPSLVSYVSRFMTLLPGDVLSTGTPGGVGHGRTPPVYLKPGDVVEYGIEGLGETRQRVVAPV